MDRGTGWRPDDPLTRYLDSVMPGAVMKPPVGALGAVETDNAAKFLPRFKDQKRSQFCVRFAVTTLIEHLESRLGLPYVAKSPLMLAWTSAAPGDQGRNVGTYVALGVQAAATYGVCSDDHYPFERQPGDYLIRLKLRPDDETFRIAERHQVTKSQRIPDGDWPTMAGSLQRGISFAFGTPLRSSALALMNTDKGGVVDNSSGAIEGYHSMVALDGVVVGGKQYVRLIDSWGPRTEPLLWPVGRYGTDEWTDNRAVLAVEEVK